MNINVRVRLAHEAWELEVEEGLAGDDLHDQIAEQIVSTIKSFDIEVLEVEFPEPVAGSALRRKEGVSE